MQLLHRLSVLFDLSISDCCFMLIQSSFKENQILSKLTHQPITGRSWMSPATLKSVGVEDALYLARPDSQCG